ncbi:MULTISPECIES: hypothetical protein [Niastella]|uniref:Transporter n=1 Tax=Niastella soli TaxID=2821487 RepID=A0ABS3YQD0_9BACT|nr:hypothetical protein [Niastella soli]MBO9200085.1 hypothetical protein [Niastella soli]
MKRSSKTCLRYCSLLYLLIAGIHSASAQTDIDGIMMAKKNLCIGPMYGYSSWKNYWEGSLKRENLNLGTVSTQMYGVMGAYGVTHKLNILFSAPYVTTKASAGTLHGMKGFQDGSLWVKYQPIESKIGKGDLSLYGLAGVSAPLSNYVADYLPLSLGLRSKTLSLRAMGDYQIGKLFATLSGTYVFRDNIKIDRDAYYTTEMHYTNKVNMPNALSFNFRAGYRHNDIVAEAFLDNWTTLGGFDITRNNMPFPSNKMNATRLGANVKYHTRNLRWLQLVVNGNHVIAGRNVGQSTSINAGLFIVFDFLKKQAPASTTQNVQP